MTTDSITESDSDLKGLRAAGEEHLTAAGITDYDLRAVILDGEVTLGERRTRNLPDMYRIGHAAAELQREVIRRAGGKDRGKRYNKHWGDLAPRHLRSLDTSERRRFIWVWQNRERVNKWYARLNDNQRDKWKWNNPRSIQNQLTRRSDRQSGKTRTVNEERRQHQETVDALGARIRELEEHNLELEAARYADDQELESEPLPVLGRDFLRDPIDAVVTYYYTHHYDRCRDFISAFNRYDPRKTTE